jgi:RNA polymerase sigma-70 factor (ECF subfamily)
MQRVSRQWFEEFVVDTRGELQGYLSRLLASREDIKEVSQEAYLKVFVALRKSPDKEHAPRALLFTTARNLAISRLRHSKVVEQSAQPLTVSQELCARRRSPEKEACASEDMRFLMQVMAMLPPKCRQVMHLRLARGLSQKEIAQKLGIAVSTVEKHLARGLRDSQVAMRELRSRASDVDEAPIQEVQA